MRMLFEQNLCVIRKIAVYSKSCLGNQTYKQGLSVIDKLKIIGTCPKVSTHGNSAKI